MDQKDKLTAAEFEHASAQKKFSFVNSVFSRVAMRYDLMNDLMSGGAHRLWKDEFIKNIAFKPQMNVVDVAGGTGDIAFRIQDQLEKRRIPGKVIVVDPTVEMIEKGKDRSIDNNKFRHLDWYLAQAEKLPFDDNTFDTYTISFGLRNAVDIKQSLEEAYRVLKPGGQFLCLEFSHIQNKILAKLYDIYSFKVIPLMGKYVSHNQDAYEYLAESIRRFPTQQKLKTLMENAHFANVAYQNLTFGTVAIHTGWKAEK